MPAALRDDRVDPAATHAAVSELVRSRTAAELRALFAGQDVCCTIMATLKDALERFAFSARGVFDRTLAAAGKTIAALPVPVAESFRREDREAGYPELGEANDLLDPPEHGANRTSVPFTTHLRAHEDCD